MCHNKQVGGKIMKTFEKKTLPIIFSSISLLDFIMLYGLRSFWSGLHAATNWAAFPYILFGVIIAINIASLTLLFVKPIKLYYYISGAFSALVLVLCIYMFFQVKDMWSNVALEFLYGLLFCLALSALVFIIFFYPKTKIAQCNIFKFSLLAVILVGILLAVLPLGFSFTNGASVYAVNDEYQIVFTTNNNGTAWVEIDGVKYYDNYSGATLSESKVHKVIVPMNALDNAKSYTIYSQKTIMREAYDGWMGQIISKDYSFRPVDTSDGVQYYAISDIHTKNASAINAVKNVEKVNGKLDFLVINGDTSSYLRRWSDFTMIELASKATNGEYPIIYARGNHETKGQLSNQLYRCVGADESKFYYTFRLGSVWGIVLDLGEDHNDDWWEYYGTSDFNSYRMIQLDFIKDVIENSENEYNATGVEYKIAICHTPISVCTSSEIKEGNATTCDISIPEIKQLWVNELNKMKLDICLAGHRHQLMQYTTNITPNTELIFKKGYTGTGDYKNYDSVRLDANFSLIIGSRRSDAQQINVKENLFGKAFCGMYGDFDGEKTNISYTNGKGDIVEFVSPWFEGDKVKFISIPKNI